MELEKIVFVGPKKVRKQLKRAVGKLPDNSIKIEFFNGMAEDRNIKIDYGLICRIVRGADGKHYCHLSGDKNCKIHIIKIPKDSKYFGNETFIPFIAVPMPASIADPPSLSWNATSSAPTPANDTVSRCVSAPSEISVPSAASAESPESVS